MARLLFAPLVALGLSTSCRDRVAVDPDGLPHEAGYIGAVGTGTGLTYTWGLEWKPEGEGWSFYTSDIDDLDQIYVLLFRDPLPSGAGTDPGLLPAGPSDVQLPEPWFQRRVDVSAESYQEATYEGRLTTRSLRDSRADAGPSADAGPGSGADAGPGSGADAGPSSHPEICLESACISAGPLYWDELGLIAFHIFEPSGFGRVEWRSMDGSTPGEVKFTTDSASVAAAGVHLLFDGRVSTDQPPLGMVGERDGRRVIEGLMLGGGGDMIESRGVPPLVGPPSKAFVDWASAPKRKNAPWLTYTLSDHFVHGFVTTEFDPQTGDHKASLDSTGRELFRFDPSAEFRMGSMHLASIELPGEGDEHFGTVLFIAQGKTGGRYWALDVTDPESMDVRRRGRSRLLWEYQNARPSRAPPNVYRFPDGPRVLITDGSRDVISIDAVSGQERARVTVGFRHSGSFVGDVLCEDRLSTGFVTHCYAISTGGFLMRVPVESDDRFGAPRAIWSSNSFVQTARLASRLRTDGLAFFLGSHRGVEVVLEPNVSSEVDAQSCRFHGQPAAGILPLPPGYSVQQLGPRVADDVVTVAVARLDGNQNVVATEQLQFDARTCQDLMRPESLDGPLPVDVWQRENGPPQSVQAVGAGRIGVAGLESPW